MGATFRVTDPLSCVYHGKAFERSEVALLDAGDWFGSETKNAADDFAGLARPEEVGRDQNVGSEFSREALCGFFGLAATSFAERDVVLEAHLLSFPAHLAA
jgi:hypothetical protein